MQKYQKLTLILLLTGIFISGLSEASAAELYLNLFRSPSIGPEVKMDNISIHTGYYTTIVSEDDQGHPISTEFVRTGLTLWASDLFYVSASHLYGLSRDWKNKHGGIYEAGLQVLTLNDRLAFRLGVAVLPSKEWGTKVNPTPGISVRFPL